MKNVIPKLESISTENSNMGQLAKYLLEYEDDLAELKISTICDDLFISIASATRLAKRLELDGFSQLKIHLAQERCIAQKSPLRYTNITSQKYYDDIMSSLHGTLLGLENETITKVSYEISHASKVNFFAVGGSNIVVTDIAQKLSRIMIPVTYNGDTHIQYVEASNCKLGHVSVGLSNSGLTHEILANLQISKKHGAVTVLITNNKNINYDFLDYVIDISSTDTSTRTYSISSRFSSLAILDLIYLNIIDSNPAYYKQLLENNRYVR